MCNQYILLDTFYMRLLLSDNTGYTRVYVHTCVRSLVKPPLRGAFGDCLCEGRCSASPLITVVHLLGPDPVILSPQ